MLIKIIESVEKLKNRKNSDFSSIYWKIMSSWSDCECPKHIKHQRISSIKYNWIEEEKWIIGIACGLEWNTNNSSDIKRKHDKKFDKLDIDEDSIIERTRPVAPAYSRHRSGKRKGIDFWIENKTLRRVHVAEDDELVEKLCGNNMWSMIEIGSNVQCCSWVKLHYTNMKSMLKCGWDSSGGRAPTSIFYAEKNGMIDAVFSSRNNISLKCDVASSHGRNDSTCEKVLWQQENRYFVSTQMNETMWCAKCFSRNALKPEDQR